MSWEEPKNRGKLGVEIQKIFNFFFLSIHHNMTSIMIKKKHINSKTLK